MGQGPDVHYEARNISLALYILGGSITFLAFIGCCAAHKRWKVLLCCYWFILSALIAAQVVVGLYVVHQAKDGKIHERLSKVWHSAPDTQSSTRTQDASPSSSTTQNVSSTPSSLLPLSLQASRSSASLPPCVSSVASTPSVLTLP